MPITSNQNPDGILDTRHNVEITSYCECEEKGGCYELTGDHHKGPPNYDFDDVKIVESGLLGWKSYTHHVAIYIGDSTRHSNAIRINAMATIK
jgi:hypothetical protein